MGYPYLRVLSETWTDTSVDFTLEQNWFLADGSAVSEEEAADALWTIPLRFSTSSTVSICIVAGIQLYSKSWNFVLICRDLTIPLLPS